MRIRAALVATVVAAATFGAPAVAAADGDGLQPGALTDFDERVTVNVVFVGFDEGDVPWNRVRQQLPSRGEPIVRSRAFYRSVRAGAAKAGVKIRVRQPSTWTVVGGPRSRMVGSTIDVEPVTNRKRFGR